MYLVGLTGGVGCGKSTVADMIRELGIPVIDMDLIARLIVEPGTPAWNELREAFGVQYFDDTGALDRQKLADLVFSDRGARATLNRITHPRIRARAVKQIGVYLMQGHKYVVLDSPLLIESGTHKLVQKVIVVTCDPKLQMKRILERNDWTREEAEKRIASQLPMEQKVKHADFVIDNDESIDELKAHVVKICDTLNSSHFVWMSKLFIFAIPTVILAVIISVIYGVYNII